MTVDEIPVDHGDERVVDGMLVTSAVASLDGDLRAVIQATYTDDLSVEASSVRLAVPVGTVKSRLKRARDRLRKELT